MKKFEIDVKIAKENKIEVYQDVIFIDITDVSKLKELFDKREESFLKNYRNGIINIPEEELDIYLKSLRIIPFRIDILSLSSIEEVVSLKDIVKNVNQLSIKGLSINEIKTLVDNNYLNPNGTFRTNYNVYDETTYEDLKGCIDYLTTIVNYVNQFELSPLEQCIFVYDLLREREYCFSDYDKQRIANFDRISELYKKIDDVVSTKYYEGKYKDITRLYSEVQSLEGDVENIGLTRSLFKVYKSDEIVCVGYASLYQAVLQLLGIDASEIYYLSTSKCEGHCSTIVNIVDDKYGENAVLEIDPTWGCVKSDGESLYSETLKNYKHFFLTVPEGLVMKERQFLVPTHSDDGIGGLSFYYDKISESVSLDVDNETTESYLLYIKKCLTTISDRYNIREIDNYIIKINNCILDRNYYECLEILEECINMIYSKLKSKRLEVESFKKALLRVKMLENFIDPQKFKLSSSIFDEAMRSINVPMDKVVSYYIFGEISVTKKEYVAAKKEISKKIKKLKTKSHSDNPLLKKEIN